MKDKRKLRALAVDFGPLDPKRGLWRAQHDPVTIEEVQEERQETRARARVFTRDPLATYRKQGRITPEGFTAGRRLEQIYERMGLEPRSVSTYGEMTAGAGSGDFDLLRHIRLKDYREWLDAIRAVGMEASWAVISVCCFQQYWRERGKIDELNVGLGRLAAHYGLTNRQV